MLGRLTCNLDERGALRVHQGPDANDCANATLQTMIRTKRKIRGARVYDRCDVRGKRHGFLVSLLVCTAIAGCSTRGGTRPAPVPELRPGLLSGYLSKEALLNSLALLPAPPAAGSAGFALDEDVARNSVALRGTRRWAQATEDADLRFPNAAGTFSCALNAPITEAQTPHLYQLLQRTLTDAGLSTYPAKNQYQRARPFVVNRAPVCTPDEQSMLEKDGSYPSGHAAVGWAWALILSEIAPDRIDAILARGLAFGVSRNVCNVHWHSDVVQGRVIGAGVVARLHAEPGFLVDLDAAKGELAAMRTKRMQPTRDCVAEGQGLAKADQAP
jgi:acid phosphatase (class A)